MRRSAPSGAIIAAVWIIASAGLSQAQPASDAPISTEQVIVTAPKLDAAVTPNAISHAFIRTYAAPSLLLGTLPRWHTPVCLSVLGVWPQFSKAIQQRLARIAAAAGAPLAPEGCKSNVTVYFTDEPQKLLDDIHTRNPNALGYKGVTTVSHPVQAWYATGTRDQRGQVFQDEEVFTSISTRGGPLVSTGNTPFMNIGGWRDRTDLGSEFLSAFIVVDTRQASKFLVGSIADYIAMLALSQTQTYDACQMVPSIANLVSADCDDDLKPDGITASDIAYLRGLYRMDMGAALQIQQDQIAAEMAKAIAVK